MKKAIIKYEKVWYKGEPVFKILGWENVLTESELPKEYFKERPYFYYNEYFDLLEVRAKHGGASLPHGIFMSINDWKQVIEIMKQAGERLHNILKKEKWQGKGKIEI